MLQSVDEFVPKIIPLLNVSDVFPDGVNLDALAESPAVHNSTFHLTKALTVCFEGGDGRAVKLSARRPAVGKPFCTLEPQNMGACRWYSIESMLDLAQVQSTNQVIPVLEASAARTVSLLAVLRLTMSDGRMIDTSSTQLELRKGRTAHSFPISIDDLPRGAAGQAVAAKIIFFIEARDVTVDLYSLKVVGIVAPQDDRFSEFQLKRLRDSASAGVSHVRRALFDAPELEVGQRLQWHHSYADGNARIDIDAANGQFATVDRKDEVVALNLANTVDSRWKTLELRFDQVENTGDLRTLVRFAAIARGLQESHSVNFVLRVYDETWESWEDRGVFGSVDVGQFPDEKFARLQISPLLTDVRTHHNIGILCFFPASCLEVEVHAFEVFTYDHRL